MSVPSSTRGKRWVFTLNNHTEGEVQLLSDLLTSEHVSYGIFGREVGESGTPHLQGYCIFADRKRFNQVRALFGDRYHVEISRGTPAQASQYCKKDGDFEEFGEFPGTQGKRSDWESLKLWCETQTRQPTDLELFYAFPSLFGRYEKSVRKICNLCIKCDPITIGEPRGWQRDLEERLLDEPNDRCIEFVLDYEGNSGKSWFVRYYMLKHQGSAQMLSVGKRDDIAHCIDVSRRVFFFDIPRGGMEFLQYGALEGIKNGFIFSPKYESTTKVLLNKAHVVVLCNEDPDMLKLSLDRYKITNLTDL